MHKASKLFWPVLVTPKSAVTKNADVVSQSQKLMAELGLVKPASNGTFQIMPLAQRALDKCINLVSHCMQSVGGQKISLPILTSASLWKKSGRLGGDIGEFFMLRDRNGKEFLLSPTHEEAVTYMLASMAPISYRLLPLRLYQVGPKFRDELKSRFGLMRAKEFLMKDMYTFDRSIADARDTYEQVNAAYNVFLRQLEVPFVKVEACSGIMGGSVSHEFHYISTTGEDRIIHCGSCDYASSLEMVATPPTCPICNCLSMKEIRGIEVAHTFLLGDKYSRSFGATYLQASGKPEHLLMGCYGIGVSRIVAAAIEVLSKGSEIRWPTLLAPYDVCIIGPKQGSKEQKVGDFIEADFLRSLSDVYNMDDVLNDDRKFLTIGKRLMDAKSMGYPLIVVVGGKSVQEIPKLELHMEDKMHELAPNDVLTQIKKHKNKKLKLLDL